MSINGAELGFEQTLSAASDKLRSVRVRSDRCSLLRVR
jgi:hypothetical protein